MKQEPAIPGFSVSITILIPKKGLDDFDTDFDTQGWAKFDTDSNTDTRLGPGTSYPPGSHFHREACTKIKYYCKNSTGGRSLILLPIIYHQDQPSLRAYHYPNWLEGN